MSKNKNVSITVSSAFTASHWHDKALNEPVHSHNFKYSVTLTGPLNEEGFLADFRALEEVLKTLNARLENKTLNDIFKYPTTENLAIYIFEEISKTYPQTSKVTVREKEDYSATYEA